MNILILEDNPEQAAGLYQYLKEFQKEWNIYQVSAYEQAVMLSKKITMDLFFLDIELNEEKTGLDFGYELRHSEMYAEKPIIYLSVRTDCVFPAINDLHCYGYLPKPYTKEHIQKLLNSLKNKTPEVKEETVILRDKNGIAFRLFPSDILYVVTENRRLHIYSRNNEYLTQYMSLQEFREKFPRLLQIHRKYLVNPSCIQNYDRTTSLLAAAGKSLPVGRNFKENLKNL